MASSSRFDMRAYAVSAAVARVRVQSDADLAAQMSLSMQGLAMSLDSPFQALTARCRDKAGGDPVRAATCDTISDVMFDHSDTLIARAIGGSIHKQLTGDSTRLDQAHQEVRAAGQHWAAATGFSPCGLERDVLKRFVRMGALGEVAAMKEDLRTPMPP
jgi:hypothetical protein